MQVECLRYIYFKSFICQSFYISVIYRYCYIFAGLIQKDLDKTRKEWNRHSIRKQKGEKIISGKPNYLFYVPEENNSVNYGHRVLKDHVCNAWNNFAEVPRRCSYAFSQMVQQLFPKMDLPCNVEEATILYHRILQEINKFE